MSCKHCKCPECTKDQETRFYIQQNEFNKPILTAIQRVSDSPTATYKKTAKEAIESAKANAKLHVDQLIEGLSYYEKYMKALDKLSTEGK